jgi:hypothetical protein
MDTTATTIPSRESVLKETPQLNQICRGRTQ